jgi:hypothetical protein
VSRTSDEPSPEAAAKLRAAHLKVAKAVSDTAVARKAQRDIVVACLDSGDGSVRAIAKAAGLNKNTVQKWSDERQKNR